MGILPLPTEVPEGEEVPLIQPWVSNSDVRWGTLMVEAMLFGTKSDRKTFYFISKIRRHV